MLQFVTDTQSDWSSGTLDGVVATASGDLELWRPDMYGAFDDSLALVGKDGSSVAPLSGYVATLRPGEGRFGGAVAVEEGTVNLHPNPNDWTQFVSNNSSLYPIQREQFGNWGRIRRHPDFETYPSSAFSCYNTLFYDTVAGEVYTFSLKVKPERDAWLSLTNSDFVLCKAGEWTTLTRTATASETGSRRLHGLYGNDAWGPDFNPWIEFKEYQVEQKPFATSFVDGTRAAGRLEYPQNIWNHATGTFAAWVKTPTDVTTDRVLTLQWARDAVGSDTRFGIRMDTTGRFVVSYGSANTLTTAGAYNDGQWHHIALTWVDGTADVHLYVDGERIASADGPISVNNPGGRYGGVIPIGHRGYTYDNQWWNGLIDELLILPYAASEEEIQRWYAQSLPLRRASSGTRASPPLDLSPVGTAAGSSIFWTATTPEGTVVTVETSLSLDGGATWGPWQACTNGGAIPGITPGMDLSNARLQTRQTLATTDTTVTPQLHDLTVSVYQLFTRSQVNHVGRIVADYSRLRFLGRSVLGYTGRLAADVVRKQVMLNRNMEGDITLGLSLRPYKLGIEWVPLGTFWSLDWDSPDDTLEAQVRARDRLELLRKGTYQPGSVQQNVSLYTLAEQVLQDAGLQPGEYAIDTALQSTVVPWAWLSPTSHREALRIIAEAALAVVYADRDGVVRIETMGSVPADPVLTITPDDYFPPLQAPSRQDQVANEIVVATQPLRPADTPQEVYKSTTPVTVPAGQTITVTVQYTKRPVIEAQAALDNQPPGVSIVAATYYAWGAGITLQNSGATQADVSLVVTGRPLSVQGGEQVVARDPVSITENGALRYQYPDNPLVQTLQQAQAIAQALLASAKDPRRDIEVEWRGNPALELGDQVTVVGQDVHVIRQEITWAGALSARLVGRRVS